MPAYGQTPISENNGTSLGAGFVRIATNNLGVVTTKEYWNYALQDWEPGPRVDAKHITTHQRLSDDTADVDNNVQFATIPRLVMDSTNVVMIVYNTDFTTGKATGVYRVYEHNIAAAISAVNGGNY